MSTSYNLEPQKKRAAVMHVEIVLLASIAPAMPSTSASHQCLAFHLPYRGKQWGSVRICGTGATERANSPGLSPS